MFVWKCKHTALQEEHEELKAELQKAIQIRNAYMSVLSQIGKTLMQYGAPSNIGLVAGVEKLGEASSVDWEEDTEEEG